MKNILNIFKADVRRIVKNRAAIVVVVALIFLPSLYAWFNILSSWDPYANTAGVPVAVANEDEGAFVKGEEVNVGDEVILSLMDNDQLGWEFVNEEEAKRGVEMGDYYASIIIPHDFTKKLTSVLTDELEKPELDYYINEKVNAIAPKVTNAGATGVAEEIRNGFVKVANEAITEKFNEVGIELEKNRPTIENVRDTIYLLEEELPEIERVMKAASTDIDSVEKAMEKANDGIDKATDISEQAEELSAKLEKMLIEGDQTIREHVPLVKKDIQRAQTALQKVPDIADRLVTKTNDVDQSLAEAEQKVADMDAGSKALQRFADLLKETDQDLREERRIEQVIQQLNDEYDRLEELKKSVENAIATLEKGDHLGVDVTARIQELAKQTEQRLDSLIDTYDSTIIPRITDDIEKIREQAPEIKQTVETMQKVNQYALAAVEKLQDVDLSERAPEITNIQEKVDANVVRVERLLTLFTLVNELTGTDRLEAPIQTLEKIQTRLQTTNKLLQGLLQAIEKGEEVDPSLLDQIESNLKEADRLFTSIVNNEAAITKAFNQAVAKMTEVDKKIRNDVKELRQTAKDASELANSLHVLAKEPKRTLNLLRNSLSRVEQGQRIVRSLSDRMDELQSLADAGAVTDVVRKIEELQGQLNDLQQSFLQALKEIRAGKGDVEQIIARIEEKAQEMDRTLGDILTFIDNEFMPKYEESWSKASDALKKANGMLQRANDTFPKVNKLLGKAEDGIGKGRAGLDKVDEYLPEVKDKVTKVADRLRNVEEQGDLDELIEFMKTDRELEGDFFAEPLLLEEHKLFPIPNYGSAMSPFFTTLSLWVGALILVSSLHVDIVNKHEYKSYEAYFGRLLLFWAIGLAQSLVVSLGNLFILKTFVVNKGLFILTGLIVSFVFMLIVYTLVSVFGNTGKVLAIFLLVMQLASSGGTFPIQMGPAFFQKIHAYMPFTHAINLFREAVGGVIWPAYFGHLLWMVAYIALAIIIGVGLKKKINKSSDKFLEKARESEVVL